MYPPYEDGQFPVHNGLPVPWVALWEAEMRGPQMEVGPDGCRPAKGSRYVRKERGMWMITGPDKREGKALFGMTHSGRQRAAMEAIRCQVCGRHRRGEMNWVVPDDGDTHVDLYEKGLILNPPVCLPCLEIAAHLCPHLRKQEPYAIHQGTARVVAVTGDLFDGRGVTPGVIALLTDPNRVWMVGREFIVKLDEP